MTIKSTNILVSSSFQGRDKSIIKSILNIDNHYGYLTLKYVENPAFSAVFLTKKNNNFYALLKASNTKIHIGKELNPKTVLSLFQHISESADFDILENHKYENSHLLEHVIKYLNSSTDQIMEIKSSDIHTNLISHENAKETNIHLLINCRKEMISSNMILTPEVQVNILNRDVNEYKINFLCENDSREDKYSISNEEFKWNIGLMTKEDSFHFKFKSNNNLIKQIKWPDYGNYYHFKEFLKLSSLLNNNDLSYQDLIRITCFKEGLINAFLNANFLLNCLVLTPNKQGNTISCKFKQSKFLQSLKKYFSSYHHN